MQGNEADYKPRFSEWNLDKMPERELLALQRALHFWRNPSNATLKLRNAVVFRPRSNCARVRLYIDPLTAAETSDYIRFRWASGRLRRAAIDSGGD